MISDNFINECKYGANHNRLGQLNIENKNLSYNEKNNLKNFSIDTGCYVDGNIIGSIYIPKLNAELINLNNPEELLEEEINAKVGILYEDNSTEYLNLGAYSIDSPNDIKTENKTTITAYNKLIKYIDKNYNCYLDFEKKENTLKDLYLDVCEQLELTPKTETFLNCDIPIEKNPFTNNESNRIVLQTIAKISCSFVKIDVENNEIELAWFSDSSEPDYVFYTSDYSTLEGGVIQFGPVNNLIIKNSQIDSENVSKSNQESIDLYGEHSMIISEDYILYDSDLRSLAIENIFNRLNGFKYIDCKLISYYGKPFLEVGNKIRVYIDESNYFDTYILKNTFTYDGSFESIIESPSLTKTQIETKQDLSLGQLLRDTQIKVNKQEGTIESITTNIKQVTDLAGNIYTKEETNKLIQEAETGLTNTFIQSGGNNIFRNTGLWFENVDEEKLNNPYEFWLGKVVRGRNDNSSCKSSMFLQEGSLIQDQEVSNGIYTVSFSYKKLIELSNVSVFINDIEYSLDSMQTTSFYTGKKNDNGEYLVYPLEVSSNHINIKFVSDTNNSLELWDLMVNKGNEKVVWTQNQNETTTDSVNISKGITITSSDLDVQFKANADGIRTLDKVGNKLTQFTDKGMTTKEATIENEATIVGILRQRVGEQIWDSFIG